MLDAIQKIRLERRLAFIFTAAVLVAVLVVHLIAGAIHSNEVSPDNAAITSEVLR